MYTSCLAGTGCALSLGWVCKLMNPFWLKSEPNWLHLSFFSGVPTPLLGSYPRVCGFLVPLLGSYPRVRRLRGGRSPPDAQGLCCRPARVEWGCPHRCGASSCCCLLRVQDARGELAPTGHGGPGHPTVGVCVPNWSFPPTSNWVGGAGTSPFQTVTLYGRKL